MTAPTKGFTPVDIPADSETKVVLIEGRGSYETQLTSIGDGWRVVGFLELESDVQESYKDERGYSSYHTVKKLRQHALLARTVTAVEADERRRKEIEESLRGALTHNHERQMRENQSRLDELAEIVKTRDSMIEDWKEKAIALEASVEKLYEQKRKMETDLARVRQAIGDLKMKEIVGG